MLGSHLRSNGKFIDTSDLIAFSDYRVPRVLRALTILHYAESLARMVDDGILHAPDSGRAKDDHSFAKELR